MGWSFRIRGAVALAVLLHGAAAAAEPPRGPRGDPEPVLAESARPGLAAPKAAREEAFGHQAGRREALRRSRIVRRMHWLLRELGAPERPREFLARSAQWVRERVPWLRSPRGVAAAAGAAGGLALLLLAVALLRRRGDLGVHLDYPDGLRGSFRVRVSKRRPKRRPRPAEGDPLTASGEDGTASRCDHPMVARETRFHRLAARAWWVSVEGVLSDAETGEILDTPFGEEHIRVRRGRTVRLTLDFRPRECPVDVTVLWDKRPVRDAVVAVRGRPASQRLARNGTARIRLARGNHVLVVGCADRVAEHPVDVTAYRTHLVVDLAASELLFKGCPPAAECYLQGDFAGAAHALERDGQAELAHLLLARLEQEQQRLESAAEHFEAAGRLLEAGEMRAATRDFAAAGALFDRAGESLRAAEMHRAAGDLVAAGEAFERGEAGQAAADCYREAGDGPRLLGALERQGAYLEAGELALAGGESARAIGNLQRVAPGEAKYADACRMLARAFQEVGEPDQAVGRLEEALRSAAPEPPPLELLEQLARALEQSDQAERALEAWETLRRRDADYPHCATRIEALHKQISARDRVTREHLTPTAPSLTPPGLARYEILEEIGRGGMGIVFRARDLRLGRIVALKRLPDTLRDHPKAVEMFLREARAAAALNHRNIVTLFDADESQGCFFLTMELLDGKPLPPILRRVGRMKPRDVARVGIQVATGLQYAHDQGVIHRDIKTGNLFFTSDRVVKIMDFGLAKMNEEVRRAVTVVAGTPYYMAPEQSAGETVDPRADLYALGVTIFELTTGRLPFEDGDVAFHHRHTPPPDPRECAGGIPDALATLVLQLLAKERETRPPTATAVAEALQRILRS